MELYFSSLILFVSLHFLTEHIFFFRHERLLKRCVTTDGNTLSIYIPFIIESTDNVSIIHSSSLASPSSLQPHFYFSLFSLSESLWISYVVIIIVGIDIVILAIRIIHVIVIVFIISFFLRHRRCCTRFRRHEPNNKGQNFSFTTASEKTTRGTEHSNPSQNENCPDETVSPSPFPLLQHPRKQ